MGSTRIGILEIDKSKPLVLLLVVVVGVVDVDDVVVRKVSEQPLCGDVRIQVSHVQASRLRLHIFC